MIATVIIEDSRLARNELREMLRQYPQINITGEADTAENALKLIHSHEPDLIFLDIHLPGKTGFDLLQELETVPAVIFTTAFDQYAMQSFEYNTIDYLLKPISAERLNKAIQKAENQLKTGSGYKAAALSAGNRIFIKDGEKCWFVTIADIYLIESKGNYLQIYFKNEHPLVLKSLQQMEEILDPKQFIRINRQQIVNVAFIDQVKEWFGGRLKLTLKSGEAVEASRRQSTNIRETFSL